MIRYQNQDAPDPDTLATEAAGIGAGLTLLQIVLDSDEQMIDKRLILDFAYSIGKHVRRIGADLSELGRDRRETLDELDVTKRELREVQTQIDAMNAEKGGNDAKGEVRLDKQV